MSLKRRPDIVYIPYPAIFVLLVFSFLPEQLRPRKVLSDAFISIHDTMVTDRKQLKSDSLIEKAVFWIERRGYEYADSIIVDTSQSADFMARKFELSTNKFQPIPLSTNESDYASSPYQANDEICRVVFIGTMIPLHGIDTVIEAARILEHDRNIRFVMIGDGQESVQIESALTTGLSNIAWERTWQSPAKLAEEIKRADICLGIFGQNQKTQRVCPLKLYSYLAVGRPIITSESEWTNSQILDRRRVPFETVPPGDPIALAEKIKYLWASAEYRDQLAIQARLFYESKLSNEHAHSQLARLIGLGATEEPGRMRTG